MYQQSNTMLDRVFIRGERERKTEKNSTTRIACRGSRLVRVFIRDLLKI